MNVCGEVLCAAPAGDWCGESPLWSEAEQAVYWTDINRFLIHRLDPNSQAVKSWFFDEPVTTLALTNRDDTIAVALGSRLILWNPATDSRVDHSFKLPNWPAVRLNDGRPDPRGSLWVGSMRNNVGADGSSFEAGGRDGTLFRIDPGGRVTEWKRDIGISNTVAWGPDGGRFYFADSLANVVWAYDFDRSTGTIHNERIFVAGFERGFPDGSAVDSEGFVWNCRFGGKCILRIAPDGVVNSIIEMPVSNITSCTFGGPARRTLYVTTASLETPATERLAGSLFAIPVAIPGLPEHRFHAFA